MTRTMKLKQEELKRAYNQGALEIVDKIANQLFALEVIQQRLDAYTNKSGETPDGKISITFGELFRLSGATAVCIENMNKAIE